MNRGIEFRMRNVGVQMWRMGGMECWRSTVSVTTWSDGGIEFRGLETHCTRNDIEVWKS